MNRPFGSPAEPPIWFDGQCQLAKSGTNLLLSRFNGRHLWIGDRARVIPADGIVFKPTGLSSATLYYAYVRADMTGYLSTVAYTTDALTGLKINLADRARLVGMARTDGSAAFADSAAQRFVRTWFNDPGIALTNHFTTNRNFTTTTYAEINSEIRIELIVWSGETVQFSFSGAMTSNGNQPHQTSIGIDGITAEDVYSATDCNSVTRPLAGTLVKSGLSEGYHYATLVGLVPSGNTGTWVGSATAGSRCTLKGFVRR